MIRKVGENLRVRYVMEVNEKSILRGREWLILLKVFERFSKMKIEKVFILFVCGGYWWF